MEELIYDDIFLEQPTKRVERASYLEGKAVIWDTEKILSTVSTLQVVIE